MVQKGPDAGPEVEAGQLNLPDVAFNPFRVKPPEGQMMAVVRANKNGELDDIIASVSGWHFRHQEKNFNASLVDEWEKWEFLPDFDPETGLRPHTPPTNVEMGMWEAEFGVIAVGFLKAIHIPHLRYMKWELDPTTDKVGVVSKDRKSPYFFFQQTMMIPVLEVESKGNFKTTIRMNIVFRLVNPYKALFLSGGWEGLVDAAIHSAVRDMISDKTVEEIRNLKEKGKLANRIKKLNDKKDGFKDKFGVEIHDVRFVGFDFVGSRKVEEALEAEEVNRLLAVAAKHKATEIETIGTANANAAAMAAQAYGSGEAAAAVKAAELMKEAVENNQNATVLTIGSAGGSPPIAIPLPERK